MSCDLLVIVPVTLTRPRCGIVAGASVAMVTRSGVWSAFARCADPTDPVTEPAAAGASSRAPAPSAVTVSAHASLRGHAGRITPQG